jgi:hypothetical protein
MEAVTLVELLLEHRRERYCGRRRWHISFYMAPEVEMKGSMITIYTQFFTLPDNYPTSTGGQAQGVHITAWGFIVLLHSRSQVLRHNATRLSPRLIHTTRMCAGHLVA